MLVVIKIEFIIVMFHKVILLSIKAIWRNLLDKMLNQQSLLLAKF